MITIHGGRFECRQCESILTELSSSATRIVLASSLRTIALTQWETVSCMHGFQHILSSLWLFDLWRPLPGLPSMHRAFIGGRRTTQEIESARSIAFCRRSLSSCLCSTACVCRPFLGAESHGARSLDQRTSSFRSTFRTNCCRSPQRRDRQSRRVER